MLYIGYWVLFYLTITHSIVSPASTAQIISKKSYAHISNVFIEGKIKKIKMQDEAKTLDEKVLRLSLKAYYKFQTLQNSSRPLITIVDYSKRSSKPRLWVINIQDCKVVLHHYVGHGARSGPDQPNQFSNKVDSLKSSIGVLCTAPKYYKGRYGYALRLIGLEQGFNNNVAQRNIVFHGSPHASKNFIKNNKRLGRSKGCFSVNQDVIKPLVDAVQGGTFVFSYYPDPTWLAKSKFLN